MEGRSTIFEELVFSSSLPDSEKSVKRLCQEGQIVIAAGTETTAWGALRNSKKMYILLVCPAELTSSIFGLAALTVTLFHLLTHRDKLSNLYTELVKQIPDSDNIVPIANVEHLPYLIRLLHP